MEENKKNYPIAEVTITTEEYRDLITEAVEGRREADYERGNRWKYEMELKALKEEIFELKDENKKLINELAKLEVENAHYKAIYGKAEGELNRAKEKIKSCCDRIEKLIAQDEEVCK